MRFCIVTTHLQTLVARIRRVVPPNATAWRPYASTGSNLSQDEKWRSLKLRKRRMKVDSEGRWWLIEERQCMYTGAIFRRTRRITE
ncbi:hypothetical protein RHI9324_05488 [Rhizobium sp. CECT 9324]|nr:hypothetical protein RHI9324_00010 [Rhizobium sp. CECT 9324]CAH0343751.1 hypothetical protein RHI9324_05488 [Rhizobium sp. CECT 9324]